VVVETVIHSSCLSFPRSCGGPICASSGDSPIAIHLKSRRNVVRVWKRKILHGDKRLLSSVPPRASRNGLLPVGGEVEGDEEQEIRAQDAHAGNCSKLFPGTSTIVWRRWEVSVAEISVGRKIDKAQINDELDDLEHGDVFLPPDANSTSGLEVVPIHDHMHSQVQRDRNPGHSSAADQLSVAEKSGRTMVIGVEESQRLLLEDQEQGVNEFEVFGQVIHIVQHNQLSGPASIVAADSMKNAVSNHLREKLLDKEGQQTPTDDGQVEIVNHKGAIENERFAMFHQFSSTEYYDIVCGQSNDRLFES